MGNQHIELAPHILLAGFMQSGIGVELSKDGTLAYTNVQILNIAKS